LTFPGAVWVGRGRVRRPATSEERFLAEIARKQLETERHRIVLIPATTPMHASHKIRVVEGQNPAWLRAMNARLPRRGGKGRLKYGLKRSRIARAIERVRSGWVDPRGYEVEILERLATEDERRDY
jgi:hypothetical protein